MVFKTIDKRIFSWGTKIFIPSLFCVVLFVVIIFVIEVPGIKKYYLNLKREMIANLVESTTDVLEYFHNMEKTGKMTRKEAQALALNQVSKMRYGPEKKDYFWINDLVPKMIMHPYRRDLDGTDLSDFSDVNGKYLFREFVNAVKYNGQGFVDYMWQWKDDPTKIVPKLSFVKQFKPWGWIVGTGIYIQDVQAEISRQLSKMFIFSMTAFFIVIILSAFIVIQSYNIEKNRGKAEKALQESHNEYKSLVENINLAIFKLSMPEEKFLKVNTAFTQMFGFDSKKEILQVKFNDLYYDARNKDNFLNAGKNNFLVDNMEFLFKKKDGSRFCGLVNAAARYNDKSEIIRIEGVIEDITERQKMEREKYQLLKTLESKNEELENIVSISYHDLRSPLTNIDGFSAVLNDYCDELKKYLIDLDLPDKINREILFMIDDAIMMALGRIDVDVKKMDRLIDGLLKISRLGENPIQFQRVDMNMLIENVFCEFADTGDKPSLKINIEQLPDCYSDSQLVYKVFYHLIDNAVKYLDPDKKGKITISGERKDSQCVFSVQDNGIGISLAHQKKVFEIFHRLNPNGNVAGEGLGLTIVRMILHHIEGSIWFESNCQEGSTFFVSLPATKKALYAVADV